MKKILVSLGIALVFTCANLSRGQQIEQKQMAATAENGNRMNLTTEIIQQRIEMFLLKNYKENHDEVVVQCGPMPTPIPVDPVDWEVKVESKYGTVKNGANLVEVTVFSKDGVYKKFSVTAHVKTFDDIVVASSLLQREQKITPELIRLERLETTNFKRDYFTLLEDVVGLQTKQVVGKDKPIFTGMVELPDIIHRGDIIKIVVKLKNMEVTATGKALQSGKRGEMIRVQNQATGKKMLAEVVDERTVLIEL